MQGQLLARLSIDLVALQEVNPKSTDDLCDAAGFDWQRSALDFRRSKAGESPGRMLGVAIAGKGQPPSASWRSPDVPMPERTLLCDADGFTVGSFHAPPGVNWGIDKARQAVSIARHLAMLDRPVLFGIDANTPGSITPILPARGRTGTAGIAKLKGEPGDDLLVGPNKVHTLSDVYRTWLDAIPPEWQRIAASRPEGPLAISHRTGKRSDHPGTPRRYDAVLGPAPISTSFRSVICMRMPWRLGATTPSLFVTWTSPRRAAPAHVRIARSSRRVDG